MARTKPPSWDVHGGPGREASAGSKVGLGIHVDMSAEISSFDPNELILRRVGPNKLI